MNPLSHPDNFYSVWGFYMLRNWQSHSDYQHHLIQRLSVHAQKEKKAGFSSSIKSYL